MAYLKVNGIALFPNESGTNNISEIFTLEICK